MNGITLKKAFIFLEAPCAYMKFIASALLLCLFAAAGVAQNKADNPPKPAQSIAELRQQLEKILQDTHTPGMSVAPATSPLRRFASAMIRSFSSSPSFLMEA